MNSVSSVAPAANHAASLNDNLVAWGTSGLFVVTAILAFYTYRLWTSTKAMVTSANEHAERQLRAYVNLMESGVKLEEDNKLHFGVSIKNFGNTPAHDLTCWYGWELRAAGEQPTLEQPTPDMIVARGSLGPSAENGMNGTTTAISYDDFNRLSAGALTFWVYGQLLYKDVFGKQRRTDFLLDSTGEHFLRRTMRPHTTGNDST